MPARHLKRLRAREAGTDPAVSDRARRWALISLLVFLGAALVAVSLMVIGIGVPSIAWAPA
jgi:hypothetical protein